MDHTAQLAASDYYLVESTREWPRRIPGGVVHEEDGLLLVAGTTTDLSYLVRTGTQPAPSAAATLERAASFFGPLGLGYSVITRRHADADLEQALEAAGYQLTGDRPAMVLEHAVEGRDPGPGAVLRRVQDTQGMSDFAVVASEAMPDWGGVALAIFGEPFSLFGMPNAIGYVAYVDDQPASATMVLVVGSVAGIDWVATRHEYRGRGLGEAVTRASVNAGFELGARIAALQAEPKAESLYRRVGFASVSSYRWYACPSAG